MKTWRLTRDRRSNDQSRNGMTSARSAMPQWAFQRTFQGTHGAIAAALSTLLPTTLLLSQPAQAQSPPDIKDPAYWASLCTTLANNLASSSADEAAPEKALQACGKALEQRPDSAGLWTVYSTLQLSQEQYAEALVSVEQALKRKEENSFAWTQRCIIHAALKQSNEALTACDQALAIDQNWGSYTPGVALRHRGLVLDEAEQYQGALVAYQSTLEENPQDSLTLVYACEALVKLKRPEEALSTCQSALEGDGNWGPANPALALMTQGEALIQLEAFEQAIPLYDQAIALLPEAHQAWTQQGFVLSELEQYTEALTAYKRAIELKDNHARALVGQCRVLNKLEQFEPALEACKAALKGNGEWWEDGPVQAWNQQSRALAGQGQWEEALAIANRAVGMDPTYFPAVSDRAVIFWYAGQPDVAILETRVATEAAIVDTRTASRLRPRDPVPWRNQGRFWRSIGEYQRALIAYNQANNLDPEDADTWANRSTVLWHLGWQDEALASADQALTLDPELVLGWQNRSVALAALKRYDDAHDSYVQALRRSPNNPDLWAGIGVILVKLKDYDQAYAALQQAIALNPEQPLANKTLILLDEWSAQQQPEGQS